LHNTSKTHHIVATANSRFAPLSPFQTAKKQTQRNRREKGFEVKTSLLLSLLKIETRIKNKRLQ